MAPRLRFRRTRSQARAQLRIPFRNIRDVAGTAVLFPDWTPPRPRSADMAVVLHLDDASRLGPYLQTIADAAVAVDIFVVLPEGAEPSEPPSAGTSPVEVLTADPVAGHLFQLTSLINSGRLVGYRTVVRHRDSGADALERFRRIPLATVDHLVRADLDRGGVYVPTDSRQPGFGADVAYRTSQLLKRVSTRLRNRGFDPGQRSLSTIAIRGGVLEFLRTLRVDQQDFYIDYRKYVNEGQATEYLKPPELDRFAGRSLESAFLVLLESSGLRLDDLDAVPAPDDVVLAGTARAQAWALYHPELSLPSRTRNATWTHLAGSMPMYLGQQLPLAPDVLGFADPVIPADRARQVHLAREIGVSAFLVATPWDADGLAHGEFFESLETDEDFPWAIMLQQSVVRRINPAGRAARLTPWVDPGEASYSAIASRIGQLAAMPSYLRLDGRPVVLVEDLASVTSPTVLLGGIREAVSAATGKNPWIGVVETELATARPSEGSTPKGADGVVQVPPFDRVLRNSMRIGGRFGGFTGPVMNLASLITGTELSIVARADENILPGAFVGFDTTPELRSQGVVGYNWNVAQFRRMLEAAVRSVAWREESRRIVIINSWNGWADTSQLEPSQHRGAAYLSAAKDVLFF